MIRSHALLVSLSGLWLLSACGGGVTPHAAGPGEACDETIGCGPGLTCSSAGICEALPGPASTFAHEGEACGPAHGCAEGLTCSNAICVSFEPGDAGPDDTQSDGGMNTDGGLPEDGGVDAGCTGPGCAGLCADVACDAPPASSCLSATVARAYQPLGTCSAGACSYTFHDVTCADGCASGRCNASGWKTLPSGSTEELKHVWGTSDSDVWAVGYHGVALHYDGASWTKTVTGVSDLFGLVGVHGTASNNVFAVSEAGLLLRWNGTAWEVRADLGGLGNDACVFALGPDDVLVGRTYTSDVKLSRVTAGVVTTVATASVPYSRYGSGLASRCALYARTPNDVWLGAYRVFHYDGSALTEDTSPTAPSSQWFHADGPNALYGSGVDTVAKWDGTAWTALPKPSTGSGAFVGPSGGPFYILTSTDYGSFYSGISEWDGTAWTPQTIPSLGGEDLLDQWASPTGTIFVVGSGGVILTGP